MSLKFSEVTNIELADVDMKDYPDFCDAFVISATRLDATPLTEVELEEFNDLDSTVEYVQENAYESLL